jgi:hypothetical protein
VTRVALGVPRDPLIVLLSPQTRSLAKPLHPEVQIGQREHGSYEQHNDDEVDHGQGHLHRLLGRFIFQNDLNESEVFETVRIVLIGCIDGDVELTILQFDRLPKLLIPVPSGSIILESVKVCDNVRLKAQLDNEELGIAHESHGNLVLLARGQ